MKNYTKTDLIEHVAQATDTPKTKTKEAVESIFEAMVAILEKEDCEKLSIAGLGIFHKKEFAARETPNPQKKGEMVQVEACRRLKFTPSKNLKKFPV